MDPKNPGVVDEILNLGDYWNEAKMLENKQAIFNSNRRVGRFFRSAYFALAEAKAIQNEWESYTFEALQPHKVNQVTASLSEQIFEGAKAEFETPGKTRRLFATAITPEGPKNYLDTILQDVQNLYIIKGEPGTGKSTLIGHIARQSELLGLNTEAYHCSFAPQNIDIVVIPGLAAAAANLSEPVNFDPGCLTSLNRCQEINLSPLLNQNVLTNYTAEIAGCRIRFQQAFERAVGFLSQAKAEHDVVESYYVSAMNFAAINAKKEEVLARIWQYAK